MKVLGKGMVIIIVFTIFIPLLVDQIISTVMHGNSLFNFRISKFLFVNYLKFLPWYIAYLITAFTKMHIIKAYKRQKTADKL